MVSPTLFLLTSPSIIFKGLYGSSSAEQDDVNVIIDALEELNAQLNPILRATLTKNYEQRVSHPNWGEVKRSEFRNSSGTNSNTPH